MSDSRRAPGADLLKSPPVGLLLAVFCPLCKNINYECTCPAATLAACKTDSMFSDCPLYIHRQKWALLAREEAGSEYELVSRYVASCVYAGFECLTQAEEWESFVSAQRRLGVDHLHALDDAGLDQPAPSKGVLVDDSRFNYSSVADHFTKADAIVRDWVAEDWASSPLSSPFVEVDGSRHRLGVTPLGCVQKHGSWNEIRMIFDCRRSGFNSTIPDLPFRYREVNTALAVIEPDDCMGKLDVKAAFNQVHLRPSEWAKLGFTWRGRFHFMRRLPFGVKSAPYIFTLLGDMVVRGFMRVAPPGVRAVVNYLDDFLIVARSKAVCEAGLRVFREFLHSLGLLTRDDKLVPPTQHCEFLGVVIDTARASLSVTPERLAAVKSELEPFMQRKVTTVGHLESLAGKLGWLARANPRCRPYLRRILDRVNARLGGLGKKMQAGRNRKSLPVRIGTELRSDLQWWVSLCDVWRPRRLFWNSEFEPCVVLGTDASGYGWGACCQGRYAHSLRGFDGLILSHIFPKELFAVVKAAEMWGARWTGRRVLALVDNDAVVKAINKHSTKCPESLPLLRRLHLAEIRHGFDLRAEHIPGKLNFVPDALSRVGPQGLRGLPWPPDFLYRPPHLWNKF